MTSALLVEAEHLSNTLDIVFFFLSFVTVVLISVSIETWTGETGPISPSCENYCGKNTDYMEGFWENCHCIPKTSLTMYFDNNRHS